MAKGPSNPKKSFEQYSPETWEQAANIASRLGKVPSSFTTTIHFLRKDIEEKRESPSSGSVFCLQRLFRSPTFKAPLYYCALTFFGEQAAGFSKIGPRELWKMFGPDGLIVAVALVYLSKKAHSVTDQSEWAFVVRGMGLESETGGYLGQAIPNIGFALGVLAGGLRHLGLAMFLAVDKNGYVDYRRQLKMKRSIYDFEIEFKRWGCNHVQVAAILAQSLGMGASWCSALVRGLDFLNPDLEGIDEEGFCMRTALVWIDALLKTGVAPDITHSGKYYPLKSDYDALVAKVAALRESGSRYAWIERGKEDVDPVKTPVIYSSVEIKRFQAAGGEVPQDEEIPEDVARELSPEELDKLKSEKITPEGD